jgi:hypothetical protein
VRRQVAVIVVSGGVNAVFAAKAATRTIPSVFMASDQPQPAVFYNGKTVEGPLVDVGPAGTNNPFWNEKDGTPPTKGKGNGAGLDATPAAWDAIGISKGDPARGKVKVDFELIARE